MTVLRAQVTIPRSTNVPADAVVNTWHFDTDADVVALDPDFDTIRDRLRTFYGVIDQYFSDLVASPATLKIYDLGDPEPRAPLYQDTIPLAGMQTADFPAEVAVVASFAAAPASGQSMRRRRGRFYFGPTNSTTRGPIVGGDVTVLNTTRTTINTALKAVADAPDPKWCVWSPTEAGVPLGPGNSYTDEQMAAGANDVKSGWVDDRYDIQRRRGAGATTRSTWVGA